MKKKLHLWEILVMVFFNFCAKYSSAQNNTYETYNRTPFLLMRCRKNTLQDSFFSIKFFNQTVLKSFFTVFLMFCSVGVWGQTPVPMASQAGLSYTENFADITNWTNDFTAGTGANRWKSYPLTLGGSANDGVRTTKSSATFVTGVSGGVQKGTGNLVFLSTGNSTLSEAVAVDFLLDFTGVNAGTLSYNWVAVDNGSGTRSTSLRVFWSTDNVTFTEITAAQVIDVQSATSGSKTLIALPAAFNNSATAKLRFYNHAGIISGSGNRDKISIDDVTVTAVSTCIKPATPNGTFTGSQTGCNSTNIVYTHGTNQPESGIDYYWQTSGTGTVASPSNFVSSGNNYNVTASGAYFVRAYNSAANCWSGATAAYAVTITTATPSIMTNPSNASVIAGNPASFSVTETGGIAYQWQEDTGGGFANISGATLSTYNTGTTTLAMTGYQYRVIVSNICGSLSSNAAMLTVTAGLANDNCSGAEILIVNTPSATAGTFIGATPSSGFTESDVWYRFTPSCSGQYTITLSGFSGPDFDFKVYANNCPASSSVTPYATAGSSNNPEVLTSPFNGSTTYYIRIFKYDNVGVDTNFNIQITTPNLGTPTNITASPASFCAGATVTFTAAAVTNANSYVWTVPADWTMTLSSTNAMTAVVGSAGAVTAQVVNCYGTGVAKSTIFAPNIMPAAPGTISGNATVCQSSSNTYTIAAVTGATSYSWTLPSGWTGISTTTSINVVAGTTGGNITVVATNTCGTSTAQTFAVTVSAPPTAPTTPTNGNAACGNVTLTRGTPPANVVWYWQGTNVNGFVETNNAVTYTATTSGTYYLRAKNTATGCWSATSSSIAVSVNEITSITAQPTNQTVAIGNPPTFTVITTGSGLSYQWQVDMGGGFANVTDGSGADTDAYITSNTTLAMNGYKYRVIVTGTCGTITSDGNATLTVSEIVYVNGDYRSINDGDWHGTATSGTTNTWQKLVGGVWTTISNSPPSNLASLGANKVYINNNISLVGTNTAPYVIVLQGGKLTSAVTVTFGNLLVKTGGEFYRMNTATGMNASGVFEIEDGGYAYITDTNTAVPTIWAGKEIFHPNSNVVIKRLDTYDIIRNSSTIFPYTDINGNSAYFGNLIIDSSVDMSIMNGVDATATRITNGDLILRTGTGSSAFVFAKGTSTSNTPYVVGGNFIIESTFTGTSSLRGSASTTYVKVNKDFIMNGTSTFRMGTAAAGVYLLVDGNVNIKDTSKFYFMNSSVAFFYSLSLKGDITVESGATFTNANTNNAIGNAVLYFTGNGDGTSDALTQTIDIAPTTGSNAKIDFSLIWPAFPSIPYVKLAKDLYLGTNSFVNVRTNSTLDFGFNGTSGFNLVRDGATSGQAFTAAVGSTLKITSPLGITSGSVPDYTGNVQIGSTAINRIFDKGATYHYIAKATQVTGNGIPNQITGKLIVELDTQNSTQDDLEFRSSGTTTFGTTSGVNGVLVIKKGKVFDEPNNGFRNYNGALDDGETDIQRGSIVMSGGRYVVSGAGTKPSLSGAYTFTAGIVEFTGTSVTKIRTSSPAKQYYNVDVSGSSVETAGKDFVVNNFLRVTDATAVLTIPGVDDNVNAFVVTAKKGVTVKGGGKFNLENNAQLMQDVNATNTGYIIAKRTATIPASTFNQYVYWSSPVDTQNFKDIFHGQPTTALYYNEGNDKFYTSSGVYIAGRGLAVRNPVFAANVSTLTAEFKGTPFVGDFDYKLFFTDTAHGNNLVGNPYPSSLDLDLLYANSTDIESTFQFWNNTSNVQQSQLGSGYQGYSYAKYNAASGTGIPSPGTGSAAPNNTGKVPNKILKVGQGFIVKAKTKDAKLYFKNDQRITAQTSAQFFGRSNSDSVRNRYLLEMETPSNVVISNAVVYFENGNNEFVADDSKLESGLSDALFTYAAEEKVVINGRSIFTNSDVLKVGIRFFTDGIYQIRLGTKEGVFANGQSIYLKDIQAGILVNLSERDYSFAANAGESDGRFEIIYLPETVLVADHKIKEVLIIYREGNQFVIQSPKTLAQVEVYDMTGKLVAKLQAQNKQAIIEASKLIKGIYFLRIKTIDGEIINRKISNQ